MEFALESENLEFNLEFRRLDVLGITAQKLRPDSERGSRTYKRLPVRFRAPDL